MTKMMTVSSLISRLFNCLFLTRIKNLRVFPLAVISHTYITERIKLETFSIGNAFPVICFQLP